MKTDQTGRRLTEIKHAVESSTEETNLILSNVVLLLEEIKDGHESKFYVWLSKHKWTTVFSIFFGIGGLALSLTQAGLVLAGLYFYPNETRALIQTVLVLLGVQ